ncbi:MAG: hypothetical protein ACRYFY_08800, partial [Janthinobacterium lividum]
ISGQQVIDLFQGFGCCAERTYVIFTRLGGLTIRFPNGTTSALLHFMNFRPRSLKVQIKTDGTSIFKGKMTPGATEIVLPRLNDLVEVRFDVESWVPDKELRNGDTRNIGLHLSYVAFNSD